MTVVARSAPGQRAAVLSDSMPRWRVIGPVMTVGSLRCSSGVAGRQFAAAGVPGRWGGVRRGPGNAAAFGCFGFIGRRARWPGELYWLCGLGGQEQDCQQGPGCGDGAGDEAADGEAAQECAGGGVLQGVSEDRVAEGRDLAGGYVRGADGLVGDRRGPAG